MQMQLMPVMQQMFNFWQHQQHQQHRSGCPLVFPSPGMGSQLPGSFPGNARGGFRSALMDDPTAAPPATSCAKGPKLSVDDASNAILETMAASKAAGREDDEDDDSVDDTPKCNKPSKTQQKKRKAAKCKGKKKNAVAKKGKRTRVGKAGWSHEESRSQIMGRTGAKGPGSSKAFKYGGEHGSYAKAKREADLWVAKLNRKPS